MRRPGVPRRRRRLLLLLYRNRRGRLLIPVELLLQRRRMTLGLLLEVGRRPPMVVVLRRVGAAGVGRVRWRRRRVPVGVRVGGVRRLLRWQRRVAGAGEAALLVIRVHGGGGAGLGGGSASLCAGGFFLFCPLVCPATTGLLRLCCCFSGDMCTHALGLLRLLGQPKRAGPVIHEEDFCGRKLNELFLRIYSLIKDQHRNLSYKNSRQ